MVVLKIVKQLIPISETEVAVYRILKLPKQIYELLLKYAKEKQVQILYAESSILPSENEIVILQPQLLIHKFALCPAVQFLQSFYYSKLYNSQYHFPII